MIEFTDHIIDRVGREFPELKDKITPEFFENPKNPDFGDSALPCFRFAQIFKKAPAAIADELKEIFVQDEYFDSISNISGYLNFKYNRKMYSKILCNKFVSGEIFRELGSTGSGKTIVIDYSHPNVAKNMGIHNLRSTIIGQSLHNIYSFLGYRTVGVNHLGDWGTQFGKLIRAIELWSSEEELRQKGVLLLNDLYVKFHSEAENDRSLEESAREWFIRLENKDPEAVKWWKLFIDVSMRAYNEIYDRLNVKFDFVTGESFYIQFLEETINRLNDKNLTEISEGALVVKFDDSENMPPCLLKKSDGATLYATRDIAAAMYRLKEFDPHKVIYVTDVAQELHFRQVFRVIEKYDPSSSGKFEHVRFGRLSFGDIQMSTRKGNIVPLEEVLDRARQKVLEIIDGRDIEISDREKTADKIGIGAVIFNDLSVSRIKNIVFDWEKTLSFEGETGPHVQYSYVRMKNILDRLSDTDNDIDHSLLTDDYSFELLKLIEQFGEKVILARNENEPSVIANYLLDLSKSFNRFYQNNRVAGEERNITDARSMLLNILLSVYGKCMDMLNIEKINRM
ncbi:MAG: arginine--tRNA ligase [Candidatus Delongbacteria bacterium]|nr:arginine--tRNA ligase [Candidatus Delongbacteria bacterium]